MTGEERAVFEVRASQLSREVEHPKESRLETWHFALMLEAVLYGVPAFLASPGWIPMFSQDAIAALVHNDPERLCQG